MEGASSNENNLEISEPRIPFYDRPRVRTALLIGFLLVFLFLIGLFFDSTFFRF